MATAVKNVVETRPTDPQARLPLAGMFGALFLVASVAAVLFGLPYLWSTGVSPTLEPKLGLFLDQGLKLVAQVGLTVILVIFGMALQGANPIEGLRGAIFFSISVLITVFFLARAVGLIAERNFLQGVESRQAGWVLTGVAGLFFLFFGWRFLQSRWARRGMVAFEHQGWLSLHGYKKTQGQRVRRLTMLGILILLGSGIYVMVSSNSLASFDRNWTLDLPFSDYRLIALPDVKFTLPLILAGLAIWFAFRVVNYPTFADFLVATEAEMNKVSWTPRKQLFHDTIVVLVTVFLITVFLLLVDLFWGWILSSRWIGVLPSTSTDPAKAVQQKQVDW